MQNTSQVLGISYAVILGLLAISVSKVALAAFRATFTGSRLEYVYDKSRLPRCGRVILVDIAIYIVYALIIASLGGKTLAVSVGTAVGFSLLALPFTILACFLSVCFVPRSSKGKPTKDGVSDKGEDDS